MPELTKQQINRQDFVDNQIFELMQKLLPPAKKIDWDIEMIGAVRDVMQEQFFRKRKIVNEEKFYPHIKENY